MKIIELDDDQSNWWIGDIPEPKEKTLTQDILGLNTISKPTENSGTPYYRYNIKPNG